MSDEDKCNNKRDGMECEYPQCSCMHDDLNTAGTVGAPSKEECNHVGHVYGPRSCPRCQGVPSEQIQSSNKEQS